MKKFSVVIAKRHSTSVTLEDDFFQELRAIATAENKSLNQLVTEIDSSRQEDNLSSAIRIFILKKVKSGFSKNLS